MDAKCHKTLLMLAFKLIYGIVVVQSVLDFNDVPSNPGSTRVVAKEFGVIHPLKQSPSGDSR